MNRQSIKAFALLAAGIVVLNALAGCSRLALAPSNDDNETNREYLARAPSAGLIATIDRMFSDDAWGSTNSRIEFIESSHILESMFESRSDEPSRLRLVVLSGAEGQVSENVRYHSEMEIYIFPTLSAAKGFAASRKLKRVSVWMFAYNSRSWSLQARRLLYSVAGDEADKYLNGLELTFLVWPYQGEWQLTYSGFLFSD